MSISHIVEVCLSASGCESKLKIQSDNLSCEENYLNNLGI